MSLAHLWLLVLLLLLLIIECYGEIDVNLECKGNGNFGGNFILQASAIKAKVSVDDIGSVEITELHQLSKDFSIVNCTRQDDVMQANLIFVTNREDLFLNVVLIIKVSGNGWDVDFAQPSFATSEKTIGTRGVREWLKGLIWHFGREKMQEFGWIGRSRGKGISCSCSRLIYDDDNWLEFRGLKLFPQAEKGKSPPDYAECASSNCPGFPWWAIVLIGLAVLAVLSIAGYFGFRYYSVRNAKLGRDVAPPTR